MGTRMFLHFTALNGIPAILTQVELLDEQLKDKEPPLLLLLSNQTHNLWAILQPQILHLQLRLHHLLSRASKKISARNLGKV